MKNKLNITDYCFLFFGFLLNIFSPSDVLAQNQIYNKWLSLKSAKISDLVIDCAGDIYRLSNSLIYGIELYKLEKMNFEKVEIQNKYDTALQIQTKVTDFNKLTYKWNRWWEGVIRLDHKNQNKMNTTRDEDISIKSKNKTVQFSITIDFFNENVNFINNDDLEFETYSTSTNESNFEKGIYIFPKRIYVFPSGTIKHSNRCFLVSDN